MWSPFPLPFHYGSLPGTKAADGEEVDAVLFGDAGGEPVEASVVGVVWFADRGGPDPKVVCGAPSGWERRVVEVFFWTYARVKSALGDPSTYAGVTWR